MSNGTPYHGGSADPFRANTVTNPGTLSGEYVESFSPYTGQWVYMAVHGTAIYAYDTRQHGRATNYPTYPDSDKDTE